MKNAPAKPYWEMTTAELRAATRKFDRTLVPGEPLTPAMRARLRRARRRGRPVIGQGAQRITTTVERQLLARADAFAKAHGVSRAELIARGLKAILLP